MTKRQQFAVFGLIATVAAALAQDAPLPTISPTPDQSPSTSPPSTAATSRSIRISFVPPPLDGTISLGIYDTSGKLVRVLHQQAPVDVFTVGADALITKWDGKDDDGNDLPSAQYHARGYTVGSLQLENLPTDEGGSSVPAPVDKVAVKLVANPLVKNDRPNVELAVGFDDTDSFLKTVDDLPLYIVSERTDISGIAMAKSGDKSIEVWQESGAGTEHFRISKLDQMMAFDCGTFDLK